MRDGKSFKNCDSAKSMENDIRDACTTDDFREDFKYYFADFGRKGGGVPPKSVTPFSLKILSVKGGRGYPPNP